MDDHELTSSRVSHITDSIHALQQFLHKIIPPNTILQNDRKPNRPAQSSLPRPEQITIRHEIITKPKKTKKKVAREKNIRQVRAKSTPWYWYRWTSGCEGRGRGCAQPSETATLGRCP